MVYISEVGSEEKVPVPVDKDNLLPRHILDIFFPGAIGLMYFQEGGTVKIPVSFDESATKLVPPADGWDNKVFYAVHPSVLSRPSTPMDQGCPWTSMEFKKIDRVKKVMDEWEDRVFIINGEKGLQGSGVLISEQFVLTAAHLSFKLYESYNIRGTNNRCFSAKCEFISKDNDFAMLKSTDLPEFGTPTGQLGRGNKYLMMGYPSNVASSKPSVTKGIIEGMMNDHIHLVGTPGARRGYSGAPVFDYFGYLLGILLGGTTRVTIDTTIRECLGSSAEQKYARILGISVIINAYNQGRSDNES